jgi:hypothetical protein
MHRPERPRSRPVLLGCLPAGSDSLLNATVAIAVEATVSWLSPCSRPQIYWDVAYCRCQEPLKQAADGEPSPAPRTSRA